MPTEVEALLFEGAPYRVQKFINHKSRGRMHWHEEIELLYFTAGEGTVCVDLQTHPVCAGDIVFVNGKEIHTGALAGEQSYYCIHINAAVFHNLIGEAYVLFARVIRDAACAALLEELIAHQAPRDHVEAMYARAKLFELLWRFSAYHTRAVLSRETYEKRFHRLRAFNDAVAYIEGHYREPLDVATLAARFYMSPSYFAHSFKKRTGKGVIEYLNGVRIEYAQELLATEELPVCEVALRVGFHDINYFSRKFKELTGKTPTAYRKSTREA